MSEELSKTLKEVFDSLTDEQKEKAKECKTDEELIKFAGEQGIELPAEVLDKVSGGYQRHQNNDYVTKCRRCGAEKWASKLKDGYCSDCLNEMYASGIKPIL